MFDYNKSTSSLGLQIVSCVLTQSSEPSDKDIIIASIW